jgi:hypothetical protein
VNSPPTSRPTTPTSKPLASLPDPSSPPAPYHDESLPPAGAPSSASHHSQRYHARRERQHQDAPQYFPPYSDDPNASDTDDVPLAYLYPYPPEAPPSYYIAVQQSYRDTLIRHIPPPQDETWADEEAGVERECPDDGRHTIEKVVAALVVSLLLIVLSLTLVYMVISF